MPLADKIAGDLPKLSEPVWKGPEVDGVTSSLLNRFLCDPERFRIMTIEGLKPPDRFNKFLEFGNMWHAMEESIAAHTSFSQGGIAAAQTALLNYSRQLLLKYPYEREDVEKWYNVCRVTFPAYVKFWMSHPDIVVRKPLLSERSFEVPYSLPNGRVVKLRGKWDSVDLVEHGTEDLKSGIWLQENKTKSEVDEVSLRRQLKFDLQTMIYLTALTQWLHEICQDDPGLAEEFGHPIVGVRYNVIRRPLSGGKGMIRPHAAKMDKRKGHVGEVREPAETMEHFYERLRTEYIEAEPETYFYRWNAEVSEREITRFRKRFLDPTLVRLCSWYDWVSQCKRLGADPFSAGNGCHWQHPYGVRNIIDEGGSTEYDNYLETGSTVGLSRVVDLFPELESANAQD